MYVLTWLLNYFFEFICRYCIPSGPTERFLTFIHMKSHTGVPWNVPCMAHSLNLVGRSAVDVCVDAVSFFGVVQKVYVFLSASTSRWDVLLSTLPKGTKVPKKQSDTRWSADAEAVDAMFHGFWKFREVSIRILYDI